MKIFHIEKGKEVVYVQKQDLMYLLNEIEDPILAFMVTSAIEGKVILDSTNQFDFIKFEEKEEIEFFKSLNFIIDYEKYKNFTDDQLIEEIHKNEIKEQFIAERLHDMPEKMIYKVGLIEERRKLKYIIKSLIEIFDFNHKKIFIYFPKFIR